MREQRSLDGIQVLMQLRSGMQAIAHMCVSDAHRELPYQQTLHRLCPWLLVCFFWVNKAGRMSH